MKALHVMKKLWRIADTEKDTRKANKAYKKALLLQAESIQCQEIANYMVYGA